MREGASVAVSWSGQEEQPAGQGAIREEGQVQRRGGEHLGVEMREARSVKMRFRSISEGDSGVEEK